MAERKIHVVTSVDLVVAFHGASSGITLDEASSSFDNALWERIMAEAPEG